MREYIILIAGAAVLSVFGDIMSPAGWKKYIKIITGLVVISIIVAPIAKFKKVDLISNLEFDSNTQLEDYSNDWFTNEFEKVVCDDIKERVANEYGRDCDVKVKINLNDENKIESIGKLEVYMDKPPYELKQKLSEMYGIAGDEVILHG